MSDLWTFSIAALASPDRPVCGSFCQFKTHLNFMLWIAFVAMNNAAMIIPRIRLSPDLRLTIGHSTAALSPGETLRLAETMIRTATRRMIDEEVSSTLLHKTLVSTNRNKTS